MATQKLGKALPSSGTRLHKKKREEEICNELCAQYRDAEHAVATGVAIGELRRGYPYSTKLLRAGLVGARSDDGALAKLLIKKGIITEREYLTATVDQLREEQRKLEDSLGVKLA